MSKPVELLKQKIDTLTAADSSSSSKDKFVQSALNSLSVYRPYPSSFLPITEKLRFSGWSDVEWTPTTWQTFLGYFSHSPSSRMTLADGISLTSVEWYSDGMENYGGIPPTMRSIIFGTTRLQTLQPAPYLFSGCTNLYALDLYKFDTSNITDMTGMFDGCSSLTELDISNFDTKATTDMNRMFYHCNALSAVDVSSFDTSNVESMMRMFEDCSSLTKLDLSNFNTSKVNNMSEMFYYCSSLKSLQIFNFDTSSVKYMDYMFAGCSSLTILDISNFRTNNVVDMYDMFANCSSLENLDLSSFNTSKVESMREMFSGCSSLVELNASNFGTSALVEAGDMFAGCTSLQTVICTKATLNKFVNSDTQLLNPDNVGADINDNLPHRWNIENLTVQSVS